MSEQPQTIQSGEPPSQPRIVYGEGLDPSVSVDPEATAQTMRELGVSEVGIANSAVYIDPKNRLMNNGTHYSNAQAKLRFRSIPELRGVEGDVVRISAKVKGKERTEELMNRTLTHELEHLAQADRHDRKVSEGHISEYGLAILGALAVNRLVGRGVKGKVGAAIGGFMGYQLGYWLAPHERQARIRAGQMRGVEPQVVSKAVKRK
jgi:hypothetical protein